MTADRLVQVLAEEFSNAKKQAGGNVEQAEAHLVELVTERGIREGFKVTRVDWTPADGVVLGIVPDAS
jgi:hypothetical protein